jgi:hypothetical protein
MIDMACDCSHFGRFHLQLGISLAASEDESRTDVGRAVSETCRFCRSFGTFQWQKKPQDCQGSWPGNTLATWINQQLTLVRLLWLYS